MASKSFKGNSPIDNLNHPNTNPPEPPANENNSSVQKTDSQKNDSVPPPKDKEKKYLRLDITNYQDYISLMSDYKTKTSGKHVSMTQYILRLIEADKQQNMELYEKLEEIEKMKQELI